MQTVAQSTIWSRRGLAHESRLRLGSRRLTQALRTPQRPLGVVPDVMLKPTTNAMRYRALGRTGLTVSEIGLGCASWWGQKAFDERQATKLVHAALDRGVTFFDTGAAYSGGEAEPRLGRALKGRALDGVVVATKAGTYHDGSRVARDFRPSAIIASVERSLRNLGLERLPLLHQSARPDAWREWFEIAGRPNVNAMGGSRYELFSLLVEAARAGLGVALMPRFFVLSEIASGELLIPSPYVLHNQRSYYLVYPQNKVGSPSLQVFCQWLRDQASAYRQETELALNETPSAVTDQ